MNNVGLWYRSFGAPLERLALETRAVPPRPPGTVRVRMLAAPINPSDLLPVSGAYAHRVRPPRVAGYEGVGVVVEAGDGAALTPGQRVLPLRGGGTWQSIVDAPEDFVVPAPEDIPLAVAARAFINPLTVLLMLQRWPAAGRRLVVTAAGSDCAALLVQWALADGAAAVSVVSRSPAHDLRLRALGAEPIAALDRHGLAMACRRADLAFDAVGGELAEAIARDLPPNAVLVSYGLLSGQPIRPARGAVAAIPFFLRSAVDAASPALWRSWFEALWPRLRAAEMRAIEPFPLNDWQEALVYFGRSGRPAKPVLTFPEGAAVIRRSLG